MTQITIRPTEPDDLTTVAEIYAHWVRTSVATFDLEEPPLSYWESRLDSPAVGDRFLVACVNDVVVGFAYSGSFRPRPAYDRTRETSVYVARGATHHGLATRLYEELLDLLRQDKVHLAIAMVTGPNPASDALHRRLGFTEVGTLDEVGFKFGAYVSATLLQLRLS